jgi:uncharacterized protein
MTNPIKFFCISLIFSSLYFTKVYAQEEKTLLWEVSGNGLSQPSYLYGTVHAICDQDFFVKESIKTNFQKTEQLFLEIDMDDPKTMTNLMKGIYMTDGTKLKSLFSESDYQKVAKFYKDSAQMNLDGVQNMKPFMLMSFLIPKISGCSPKSYEAYLMALAKEQKKEVLGLETAETQMAALDKLGIPKQAEAMLKMVDEKEWAKGKTGIKKLISDYKNQDLDALYKDVSDVSQYGKDFEKALLEDRNKAWIPVIRKASAEKSTFFAFGSGHLGGANGVIKLLRKEGFSVTAVK